VCVFASPKDDAADVPARWDLPIFDQTAAGRNVAKLWNSK
jgi:hypothetical protein